MNHLFKPQIFTDDPERECGFPKQLVTKSRPVSGSLKSQAQTYLR